MRVEDRLEAALGVGELVGLDVDERDVVRGGRGGRLDPVERRAALVALWQNAGVANTSTNGVCSASASATDVS